MARSLLHFSLQFLLLYTCLPLLITTVSAVNLSRCGTDTACLVSRCEGDLKNPDLVLFDLNQTKISLETCKTVFQFKKLSLSRYAVFLRLNFSRTITEKNCNLIWKIGDSVFFLTEFRLAKESFVESFTQFLHPNLYEFRLEFIPPEKEKFGIGSSDSINLTAHFVDRTFHTNSISMDKVIDSLRATETCSMQGLSHIGHLSPKEYLVEKVDFADIQLNCPASFDLSISKKGRPRPIRIREIYCENNQWQTNFFNASNEVLLGFIDEAGVIAHSLGNDTHKLTIVDELSIGCVKKRCSGCSAPPPHIDCEYCTPPKFTEAPSNLHCASVMCPTDRVYTQDGKNWSFVPPDCYSESNNSSDWYLWNNRISPIRQLTCLLRSQSNEENAIRDSNDKGTEEKERTPIGMAQKSHNKTGKYKYENNKAGDSAGNWLKENWIGSILIPFIIIAGIGGCVVFLVFMLKTKDEQENLMREGRRREEERLNEFSSRNSPDSPSSTRSSRSEEILL